MFLGIAAFYRKYDGGEIIMHRVSQQAETDVGFPFMCCDYH